MQVVVDHLMEVPVLVQAEPEAVIITAVRYLAQHAEEIVL
jgi:hypothetical protein